jgi:hypothetical protein
VRYVFSTPARRITAAGRRYFFSGSRSFV